MSRVKNEHYVPQIYLKNFTNDNKKIFLFDKFSQSTYQTNLNSIANENYFYDFPKNLVNNEEEIQAVERELSNIEGSFNTVLSDVLNELTLYRKKQSPFKRRILYKKTKAQLAFYITIQIHRTKEHREFLLESYEKVPKAHMDKVLKLLKVHRGLPDEITLDNYDFGLNKELITVEHAKHIFDPNNLNGFVNVLSNYVWVLGVNTTSKPFYTSDNPVVLRSNVKNPFFGSGYFSYGAEISFPLSSKVMLTLFESNYFKTERDTSIDGKAIKIDDDKLVSSYNSLQVLQSYRQVYCRDGDFSFAEEVCKKYPEVCSEKRERIKINGK